MGDVEGIKAAIEPGVPPAPTEAAVEPVVKASVEEAAMETPMETPSMKAAAEAAVKSAATAHAAAEPAHVLRHRRHGCQGKDGGQEKCPSQPHRNLPLCALHPGIVRLHQATYPSYPGTFLSYFRYSVRGCANRPRSRIPRRNRCRRRAPAPRARDDRSHARPRRRGCASGRP